MAYTTRGLNHKTKLARVTYTQARLGISSSAYYKKSKDEQLKLRRKVYKMDKGSAKGGSSKTSTMMPLGFFNKLFS